METLKNTENSEEIAIEYTLNIIDIHPEFTLTCGDKVCLHSVDVQLVMPSSTDTYDCEKEEMITPTSIYMSCGMHIDVMEPYDEVKEIVFGV